MEKLKKLQWRKSIDARLKLSHQKFDELIQTTSFSPSWNFMYRHRRRPARVHFKRAVIAGLIAAFFLHGAHLMARNDPIIAHDVHMRMLEKERINNRKIRTPISMDLD